MSNWVLTKGLTTWRSEINSVFPTRDKESDGSIGDTAHAQGTSGHNDEDSGHAEFNDWDGLNEVRAIDVDKDLRNPKFTMEQLIQWLVTLGRAGTYLPFRYFIFNGRIWRKSTGWKTQTYTGPNKHDHHAHFSGDYTQKADNWTGLLGLAAYVKKVTTPPEEDLPVKQSDFDALFLGALKNNKAIRTEVGKAVLEAVVGGPLIKTRTVSQILADVGNGVRARLVLAPSNPEAKTKEATPQAGSVLDIIEHLPTTLSAVQLAVNNLGAQVTKLTTKPPTS